MQLKSDTTGMFIRLVNTTAPSTNIRWIFYFSYSNDMRRVLRAYLTCNFNITLCVPFLRFNKQ